jgi:hypothetical protein
LGSLYIQKPCSSVEKNRIPKGNKKMSEASPQFDSTVDVGELTSRLQEFQLRADLDEEMFDGADTIVGEPQLFPAAAEASPTADSLEAILELADAAAGAPVQATSVRTVHFTPAALRPQLHTGGATPAGAAVATREELSSDNSSASFADTAPLVSTVRSTTTAEVAALRRQLDVANAHILQLTAGVQSIVDPEAADAARGACIRQLIADAAEAHRHLPTLCQDPAVIAALEVISGALA